MPNKYQLLNEMARETLKEITSKAEEWMKFLDTASSNYKYDFNEQVLIYAQKSDATACAEIEIWNKRLKRWVTKGAKGIALISLQDGRNIIRLVFDISDTYSGINKELKLWEVKESYHNGLIETLENSFGDLVIKGNLAEAIYSATQNLVEDNYNDYLRELKEVVNNSSLKDLNVEMKELQHRAFETEQENSSLKYELELKDDEIKGLKNEISTKDKVITKLKLERDKLQEQVFKFKGFWKNIIKKFQVKVLDKDDKFTEMKDILHKENVFNDYEIDLINNPLKRILTEDKLSKTKENKFKNKNNKNKK